MNPANGAAYALHSAMNPGWSENRFGAFRVLTQIQGNAWVSPMASDYIVATPPQIIPSSEPWVRFPSGGTAFELTSGGGAAVGCVGAAVVKMHGVGPDDDSGGAYPPVPVDAETGEPCYATSKIVIHRATSEARCEPDLRQRYPLTDRFYAIWDNAEAQNRVYPELIQAFGAVRDPLFPTERYTTDFPHTMGRRYEHALHMPSETLEDDGTFQPAPGWQIPTIPVSPRGDAAAVRRGRLERFVDPDERYYPFGGEALEIDDYTGAPASSVPAPGSTARGGFQDCLEIAPAGWRDDETGRFDPICRPEEYTTPYAGFINHEVDTGEMDARAERTPEAGARDQREGVQPAIEVRRPAGLYPINRDGWGWFQHKKSTLGCLNLIYDQDNLYWSRPNLWQRVHAREAAELIEEYRNFVCPGDAPPGYCEAYLQSLLDLAEEHMALAFGWSLIGTYREPVAQEFNAAQLALGYRYASSTLNFYGIRTNLANRTCYTGPVGQGGYNHQLAPVGNIHGLSMAGVSNDLRGSDGEVAYMVPSHSGNTWYKEALEVGRNEHEGAGGHQMYSYRTEVRGEASARAREDARARTGIDEPYPLDMGHSYTDTIRDSGYTFRDFACPTTGGGYYGMATSHVGPDRRNHREDPAEPWRNRDPEIDASDGYRRYPTGTPCVPETGSPVSYVDGSPLAQYYNVRGRGAPDPDDGSTVFEDETCHEAEWVTDPGAYIPVPNTPGGYSSSDTRFGADGTYYLEYSGDGTDVTLQPDRERMLRPNTYLVLPYSVAAARHGGRRSEYMRLEVDGRFGWMWHGLYSLDHRRQRLRPPYGGIPRLRVHTEEVYAGVAPGWLNPGAVQDRTQAPSDTAHVTHNGPVRFFGAMYIGNAGGCALGPSPPGPGGTSYDTIRHVLHPEQEVMCFLPENTPATDAHGSCPNASNTNAFGF